MKVSSLRMRILHLISGFPIFLRQARFVLETDGSFEAEHIYERDKLLLEDYLAPDGGEKNIVPVLGGRVRNR